MARTLEVLDARGLADGLLALGSTAPAVSDVGVTSISWRSRFHCDERQVTQYRTGRVFLAGDAAHVHSPMGGQGMNTGIQDAANLAWKLDAALGGAPDSVLDTYHSERHPIGQRVLLQSGLMMRAVTLYPRPVRRLRDLLAPNRLVGTRATEVPLVEGRLTEIQRQPGFVMIHAREETVRQPSTGRVKFARRTDEGPALLVRPDGYIAWAGPGASASSAWHAALTRWTGARAAHVSA